MFEAVELGRTVDAQAYESRMMELRTQLLALQRRLKDADFPVFVLISGFDGAGRHEIVNQLHTWLDARHLVAHAFGEAQPEERGRPPYWRYWRAMAPRGNMGVYLGHWYTQALDRALDEEITLAQLDVELSRIVSFERTLADEGTLIIKLWLHMPRAALEEQVKRLRKSKDTSWQISTLSKKQLKHHARFARLAERAIRSTDSGYAPWTVVEATDSRHRDVSIAEHLLARLEAHLEHRVSAAEPRVQPAPVTEDPETILDRVDLTADVDRADYKGKLARRQARLARASLAVRAAGLPAVVLFEGWDAAGKGGAIRRMLPALDATHLRVIPVSAPTDEEAAHHYLWRFWRHLPRPGHLTIFDRSWYGRVLVERVEGFASQTQWRRAYREINEFEEQLYEGGVVLVKFWLHISPEEQLRRFEERERVPYKRHKITEDDWRNRDKWNAYEGAAAEMVARTSTEYSPWNLVSAQSKKHARLEVLKKVTKALGRAVGPAKTD